MTFSPTAASAVPRLMAVVVLPTPPFWFATARMRGPPGIAERSVTESLDFHNSAARIRAARNELTAQLLGVRDRGQFFLGPFTARKERNRAPLQIRACISYQGGQIGQRPGGEHVHRDRPKRLHSGVF